MATDSLPPEGVAIIGLAGRFPGARDVRELWQNLCTGTESITHFTDEDLLRVGYLDWLVERDDFKARVEATAAKLAGLAPLSMSNTSPTATTARRASSPRCSKLENSRSLRATPLTISPSCIRRSRSARAAFSASLILSIVASVQVAAGHAARAARGQGRGLARHGIQYSN